VDDARLAAEQRARVRIDEQLTAAGWVVQDRREMNLFAAPGVAVREVVMAPGHGRVDYLLYVDRRIVGVIEANPERPTWRAKVRDLPPLAPEGLRPAQITAIAGIERSLAEGRHDRALVQMATGAGKTYTAVSECYRLLKHGGMRRILFLVDRTNLGEQTKGEFEGFVTPDDGRKFPSLYPVDMLTAAGMLESTSVVISTIQRVHAVLHDRTVTADDDPGLDSYQPDAPVEVPYSTKMPPESFDLVIVDECHRSIYGVWRGVLEYFDAHLLGLTATPVKQTFGFFRQNLVSEYTYPQSVVDGVNVDFDVYRISTEITEQGSTVEAGAVVPVMDRRTRVERYKQLDDDLTGTTAPKPARSSTAR